MGIGMTLEVCESCALEKLPLVIADAITLSPASDFERSREALKRIEGSFWRGLAHRFMAERREGHQAEVESRSEEWDDEPLDSILPPS
jgi:hypothetical protein